MTDLEKEYNKFWKDIVENDDGSLNKEQVMKELSDFQLLIDNLTDLYCYISGNACSKVLVPAKTVLGLYETVLETSTDTAYRDGHKDGYDAGCDAGFKEGYNEGYDADYFEYNFEE
jgi:hypothetical protein